jgi:hypothetical protein
VVATRSARVLNHATCSPACTACWPRASSRNVLPVPEGPHTTRFSRRWIHSRVRSADWLGAGIDDSAGSQAAKVMPVGNPARARRVASADRSRPETSSARRTQIGADEVGAKGLPGDLLAGAYRAVHVLMGAKPRGLL